MNWCIENRAVNFAKVHRNLYHKLREAYKLPARPPSFTCFDGRFLVSSYFEAKLISLYYELYCGGEYGFVNVYCPSSRGA